MISISVGEVSGVIAAGVFLLQLIIPLALPAILIAFLSDRNSVATWAVLGRFLHSSQWPSLLQTDTATSTGVKRNVRLTGWLQTVFMFIISVASIVTPLGLYSSIDPGNSPTAVTFNYSQDTSAFGSGTPPRTSWPFTDVCGTNTSTGGPIPCPGGTQGNCTTEGPGQNCTLTYDLRIPIALGVLFNNGATNFSSSVSSIFDIQWRSYFKYADSYSSILYSVQAAYRQLSTLILNESVQIVEGLIVDMVSGGIGFRNHTVPASLLEYGAKWDEDLLFVQPVTQCVNLNVTVDYQIDSTATTIVGYPLLTDQGGYSALNRTAPSMNLPKTGQGDINLQERAYSAAWLTNFLTLSYFNATGPTPSNITRLDVKPGQSFPIDNTNFVAFGNATSHSVSIQSTIEFGSFLNFSSKEFENPNGINSENFDLINDICGGTSYGNPANISSVMVGCGLLFGAATRTDGGSNLLIEPLSRWSLPIYSCASAVQATVKTATFQYNGTGLDALKVTSLTPKSYQNSTGLPLWGVQNLADLQLGSAMPMWGILGSSNSSDPPPLATTWDLSMIYAESLYLPGFLDQYYVLPNAGGPVPAAGSSQYVPALNFYSQALYVTLTIGETSAGEREYQHFADYSGATSLALYTKWQQLSNSSHTASSILNFIWTDVAANAVIGTKGWGLHSEASSDPSNFIPSPGVSTTDVNPLSSTLVPVMIYQQRIRYRLPFAVPAIVVLAILLTVLTTVVFLIVTGKTGVKRMRHALDATSNARIIAKLLWPPVQQQKTKDFVSKFGNVEITITNDVIAEEEATVAVTDASGGDKPNEPKPNNLIESNNNKLNEVDERESESLLSQNRLPTPD